LKQEFDELCIKITFRQNSQLKALNRQFDLFFFLTQILCPQTLFTTESMFDYSL
jgi:hypothetical protein